MPCLLYKTEMWRFMFDFSLCFYECILSLLCLCLQDLCLAVFQLLCHILLMIADIKCLLTDPGPPCLHLYLHFREKYMRYLSFKLIIHDQSICLSSHVLAYYMELSQICKVFKKTLNSAYKSQITVRSKELFRIPFLWMLLGLAVRSICYQQMFHLLI